MAAGLGTRSAPGVAPEEELHRRRNAAERRVRDAVAGVPDVYVDRASWRVNGNGPEIFVAIVARTEEARQRARDALAPVAGLTPDQWASGWIALDLGDAMIRLFPERAN